MLLESLSISDADPLSVPIVKEGDLYRWDWSFLVSMMLSTGLSPSEKSSIFHASLALAMLEMARTLARTFGIVQVGFAGGVFQNARLSSEAQALLRLEGFDVLIPSVFPMNDAAISLGQLVEASAVLRAKMSGSTVSVP